MMLNFIIGCIGLILVYGLCYSSGQPPITLFDSIVFVMVTKVMFDLYDHTKEER